MGVLMSPEGVRAGVPGATATQGCALQPVALPLRAPDPVVLAAVVLLLVVVPPMAVMLGAAAEVREG